MHEKGKMKAVFFLSMLQVEYHPRGNLEKTFDKVRRKFLESAVGNK